MNANKSTAMLQSSYNHQDYGMGKLVLPTEIDDRYAGEQVNSRIGLFFPVEIFNAKTDLLATLATAHKQ